MGNKSTLKKKYRSKEKQKFEEWLDRVEGRMVFNIRAGSQGLRNRTGRTAHGKSCQKCTEGEIGNEQHVVLKCPAYRVERNRLLVKVKANMGGGGGGGQFHLKVFGGGGRNGRFLGGEEGSNLELFYPPSPRIFNFGGEGGGGGGAEFLIFLTGRTPKLFKFRIYFL